MAAKVHDLSTEMQREAARRGEFVASLHEANFGDSWWKEHAPDGIPVYALFGSQGGTGTVGTHIKKADKSGDGYLSKLEFRNALENAVKEEEEKHSLKKVIVGLSAVSIVVLAIALAMTFATVELTKETGISSDGTMVDKSTGGVIRTASSEFHPPEEKDEKVPAGAMLVSSGQLLKTTEALVSEPLSSTLSNSRFNQLKTLKLSSETHQMSIAITGYMRDTSGQGAVTLFSPRGAFLVDGTNVEVLDEDTALLLRRAGFAMNTVGSRRRLFALATTGDFNDLASTFDDKVCEVVDWATYFASAKDNTKWDPSLKNMVYDNQTVIGVTTTEKTVQLNNICAYKAGNTDPTLGTKSPDEGYQAYLTGIKIRSVDGKC